MSTANPFEATITARLVAERVAGKAPVLTLDEVVMLGGEVEDGHIDRFGPSVSSLIDSFGAEVIPDEEPRGLARDLSDEESADIIARHQQGIDDRRNEKRYHQLRDQHAAAIKAERERYDVDEHTALGYLVKDFEVRLRAAGKADEADAEVAAWKWGDARQKAAPQSTGDKVKAALKAQAGE